MPSYDRLLVASSKGGVGKSTTALGLAAEFARLGRRVLLADLATTSRSIKTVSEACGYADLAYLKTLFKRRFGCTMRDWRAQNRTP